MESTDEEDNKCIKCKFLEKNTLKIWSLMKYNSAQVNVLYNELLKVIYNFKEFKLQKAKL